MVKKGKKSSTKTCLCSTCSAELSDNSNSICCNSCNNWHHGSCVNLSPENSSFLGSSSNNLFWKCNSCISIKVTPLKTLEAKIDSVLFKLEESRTEIQPAQPSKPIEVLKKTINMIITIEFVFPELVKAKKNHLLIDNLLIKKKWKNTSKN